MERKEKAIDQVVKILKDGGLVIYPSDTVYGLGCDITNLKAMEKLARLKGVKLEKAHFSIICNDLSHLSNYTLPIDNSTFKILKRALPGPFTFVMNASRNLPSAYKGKKTVGIRVPDHLVPQLIVEKLGNPIASTSIYDEDEIIEYTTDPELIYEKWENLVDAIVDSGYEDYCILTVTVISMREDFILHRKKILKMN